MIRVAAEADPVREEHAHRARARDRARDRRGARLADTTRIRVTDSTGAALDNVPVTWIPLDGGTIEALAPRTGSHGEAWARWTLGPRAGKQRARVQVGNPRTMPAFTISAIALRGLGGEHRARERRRAGRACRAQRWRSRSWCASPTGRAIRPPGRAITVLAAQRERRRQRAGGGQRRTRADPLDARPHRGSAAARADAARRRRSR